MRFSRVGSRALLANAGSMIGTTAVTSGLGVVYWWFAAHQFSPEAVGFASAAVSAMMMLTSIGIVGLGTLLIGELPRQSGQRGALVLTSLVVSGVVGALLGTVFAVSASGLSNEFQPLAQGFDAIILFACGVGFTAVTVVLDQALIGLMRGHLQLWRNTIFAITKLAVLILMGWWLVEKTGMAIYTAWLIGNLVSLLALLLTARREGVHLNRLRPEWHIVRRLPRAAIGHHFLNLGLQLPGYGLPLVVTALLSAQVNASFYIAWLVLSLAATVPFTLAVALFSVGVVDSEALAHKLRLTLGLAIIFAIAANVFMWISADFLLNVFGRSYADQAAWALRIMSLGVFPLIVKDHYVAIGRIDERLSTTTWMVVLGGILELGLAGLGALMGDLQGLSTGWVIALCVEAVVMLPTVWSRAVLPSLRNSAPYFR